MTAVAMSMTVSTMAMMMMAMVVMVTMMVVAMMVVVMVARRSVIHRLPVIDRSRTDVVDRWLVEVDATGNVAITKHHASTDTRVGAGDFGAQQAADEKGCKNNLLHGVPPYGH